MHRLNGTRAILVCLALGKATGSQAEDAVDQSGLAYTLELKSHQALIDGMRLSQTTLAPFETDGCSGGLSDVWDMVSGQFTEFAEVHEEVPPWEDCCITHDRAYHDVGGAELAQDSYDARVTADDSLRSCVIHTGERRKEQVAEQYGLEPDRVTQAYGLIAEAMHLAVRFGGAPCSGLSWRWGYGYPDCSVLQRWGAD